MPLRGERCITSSGVLFLQASLDHGPHLPPQEPGSLMASAEAA